MTAINILFILKLTRKENETFLNFHCISIVVFEQEKCWLASYATAIIVVEKRSRKENCFELISKAHQRYGKHENARLNIYYYLLQLLTQTKFETILVIHLRSKWCFAPIVNRATRFIVILTSILICIKNSWNRTSEESCS